MYLNRFKKQRHLKEENKVREREKRSLYCYKPVPGCRVQQGAVEERQQLGVPQ
jgi:hypothetical protein